MNTGGSLHINTQATSEHLDRVAVHIDDYLAQAKKDNMEFYLSALANDELTVIDGKDKTKKSCRCDICRDWQEPGVRKFWYQDSRPGELHSWWFQVCPGCFDALSAAYADAHLFVSVSIPTE